MIGAVPKSDASQLSMRAYRPGDERAILPLFEASFGKPMSKAYWNWRYRDNPVDAPMIELAWNGDQLAAHYAVSPLPMVIGGTKCKAALSMTTMTHPDYRGLGLFPLLAERLYERLARQGYKLVFGFPNQQSHRTFTQRLGWQDLAPVPQMSVALSDLRPSKSEGRSFAVVDRYSDWLGNVAASPSNASLARDIDYYNWRMIDAPENTYRVGIGGGEGALGFIAFKKYEDAFDLVDFAATPDTLGPLVGSVAAVAREEGVARLNTWLPVFDPLFPSLERMGFAPGGPVTYMGGRVLQTGRDIMDSRQWSVRMVMSDVY